MSLGFWFQEQMLKWRRLIGQTDLSAGGVNSRSIITAIAALVILFFSIWAIMCQLGGGRRNFTEVRNVYFFDVTKNELFEAPATSIAPIDVPSGQKDANGEPAGVRANVFSCGSCSASNRFIAYLQKYSLEARDKMMQFQGPEMTEEEQFAAMEEMALYEQQIFVADAEELKWHPIDSEEGMQIREKNFVNRCKDSRPRPCYPGR